MSSRSLAGKHYVEHEGKPFFDGLVSFLSSGTIHAFYFMKFQHVSPVLYPSPNPSDVRKLKWQSQEVCNFRGEY